MPKLQADELEHAVDGAREKIGGGGGRGDLAKRLIVPSAAGLGGLAATYALRKAPELLRNNLKPKLEQEGEEEATKVGQKAAQRLQGEGGVLGKVAGKAAEKLGG